MASLFTSGRFYGPPLGTLKTYAAGTLTPLATYTTQAGATANPTTINIPASGYAAVWLGDGLAYRMIVADANGVVLYDEDNITRSEGGGGDPDSTLRDDLAGDAAADKGAGIVAHSAARAYPQGTVGAHLRQVVYADDAGVLAVGNYNQTTLTGTDDTVALQAGLDLAGSRTAPPTVTLGMHGLSLANAQQGIFRLAPRRNYRITQPLKVPPGVEFDLNGSTIWQTGTGDAVQLLYQGLGYSFYGRFYDCVRNGTIIGPGAGTSNGRGLFLDLVSGGKFDRLIIQGFRYGLAAWETQYSTFTDVRCFYNVVGRYFTAAPAATTLCSIDNASDHCSDAFNTLYGMWLQCDSLSGFSHHDASRNGVCDVLIGGQLTGQLRAFTVSSGGSGYTPGVINVTITDPDGTMAQAYAEVNGSGVVTGVFSVDAGMGYTSPTISVPGGGVAAVVTSTPVTDSIGDWVGSSVISRGRNVIELKCEHADADRPLSGYAVIINGDTHRQNRFPNLCVQRQGSTNRAYFRWLFNSGRGNVVEFPGDPSNNPSAITRPGAAADMSIFRSAAFQGLTVAWGGGVDGNKVPRYGVDQTGAVDYASNINYGAFAGDGELLSTWFLAETSFGEGAVYKARVTGDAHNRLEIAADGTVRVGAGASAPTAKLRLGTAGVSADRGDASVTLTAGTDAQTQRFATALTANRTVTLSATGAVSGDRFRVVRTGLGAFTLDVGGLKTIASATAAWVDVEHDGTAWRLTGYGTL